MDIYEILDRAAIFSNARFFQFEATSDFKTFRTAENYFAIVTAARHHANGPSMISPYDYHTAKDSYYAALSSRAKRIKAGFEDKTPDQMLIECHHNVVSALHIA